VVVVSLGLLAVVVEAPRVEAQDPYSCLDELEEAELDARLAMVDQRLQDHKLGARLWWYGWQAFFGAVIGYQATEIFRSEPGTTRRWASVIGTPAPGAWSGLTMGRAPWDEGAPSRRRRTTPRPSCSTPPGWVSKRATASPLAATS